MKKKKKGQNYINGVPELLVLKLLQREKMYGYQLVKNIKDETLFSFGEGCIYPLLHNLENDHFISTKRAEINGRTRVYYQLTEKGENHLSELSNEWFGVAKSISEILQNKHGRPKIV